MIFISFIEKVFLSEKFKYPSVDMIWINFKIKFWKYFLVWIIQRSLSGHELYYLKKIQGSLSGNELNYFQKQLFC